MSTESERTHPMMKVTSDKGESVLTTKGGKGKVATMSTPTVDYEQEWHDLGPTGQAKYSPKTSYGSDPEAGFKAFKAGKKTSLSTPDTKKVTPPPAKKKGSTLSYKEAYDEVGGAGKLGDYGAWEKRAKDWNVKKYGSETPTAKARSLGISKSELAKEQTHAITPVKIRPAKTESITESKASERMQQTVNNALSTTHKIVPTRKQSRQAARAVKQTGRLSRKTQRLEGRLAKTKGKTATATAVGTPEARLSPEEASKILSKIGSKQFGL